MVDRQRAIIRHSVKDVIRILENEPVKVDMVHEITAVQVMNRVSIAHLSIERALKFLITKAGGPLTEDHNLNHRYQELQRHDPGSARFLEEIFAAAVQHYRYNPNTANMTHLKTLERYLEVAGSARAFQDIRYWELTQSLDEMVLRRIYLSIHIELLHGLSDILLAPNRQVETVKNRVERAVKSAMWRTKDMGYSSGTPKEQSVKSYMQWRRGFSTWSDALAAAVQEDFNIGDDFMANTARNAYRTLFEAVDPAVRYFVNTMDVLPRQPRDMIPCVDWRDPERERIGSVSTPAGTMLGLIERGLDALWYITPLEEGVVSAKARSQTDARCYLANLLTKPARINVGGEERSLRIVREEGDFFQRNYDEITWPNEQTGDGKTWTHKVTLWDKDHGIEVNERVRVEVRLEEMEGVVEILEGTVTEVAVHEVYVSGSNWVGKEQNDYD